MRAFQSLVAFTTLSVCALAASAAKRNNWPNTNHVTTHNGQYVQNGKPLKMLGTNLYWLSTLNCEEDMNYVLANVSSFGFNSFRTWAFNDVEEVPLSGTWFQKVKNGQTKINEGPDGLQKLDQVIRAAENNGMYVIPVLTNNWNPLDLLDPPPALERRYATPGSNSNLPRNSLSNDYGGMDTYVRQFGHIREHDQFYQSEDIIQAFLNYLTVIVTRYKDSPAILQWEIANDARCRSSLPASANCNPTMTTQWFARVARHIKSIDPHHVISTGTQGFLCIGCPKSFPSPSGRRSVWERWALKRQDDNGLGPSFDGYHGIDSEDLNNIPEVGAGTVSFFPDQNEYGPKNPDQSEFENNLQGGQDWIQTHVESGAANNKPVSLTAAGMVTQANRGSFVPFNRSTSPFPGTESGARIMARVVPDGITPEQRNTLYSALFNATTGLNAAFQYSYGQGGLAAAVGTPFASGSSPNDGYSESIGSDPALQAIFAAHSQDFGL